MSKDQDIVAHWKEAVDLAKEYKAQAEAAEAKIKELNEALLQKFEQFPGAWKATQCWRKSLEESADELCQMKERAETAEQLLAGYKANHLTAECGEYYARLCEGKGIALRGLSLTVTEDGLLYSVPSLAPRIVTREETGEHLAYWAAACRWMENEEVK